MTTTIGTYSPEGIKNVRTTAQRGDELGECRIEMVNTSANRSNIRLDDDISISRGAEQWDGNVVGYPPADDPDTFVVRGLGRRIELKHGQLQQVFYDTSRSETVKQAVQNQAQLLDRFLIHTGDDLTDWSSNAPVSELYGGLRAGLYDWGSDLIFMGARSGHRNTLTATYSNVTTEAIEDQFYELSTRLAIGDRSGTWGLEVELVTPGGTTYVWEPELSAGGFETLTMATEEATTDGQVDDTGVLQYRFNPAAEIADNTGVFLDHALTLPYRLRTRQTSLSTTGVVDTDDSITVRAEESLGTFIEKRATEAGYQTWVNDSDELQFRPGGEDPGVDI